MTEWQPIETAPKDRMIIVANDDYFGAASPMSDGRWFMWNSFFTAFRPGRYDVNPNAITPTHWMPLPEPPNA